MTQSSPTPNILNTIYTIYNIDNRRHIYIYIYIRCSIIYIYIHIQYILYIYTILSNYHQIISGSTWEHPLICPTLWSSIFFFARLVQIGQAMRICSQGLVNISENITCTTLAEGLGRWWLTLVDFQWLSNIARWDFLKFIPQNCQKLLFYQFYVLLRTHTQWYSPHIKLPSCHTSLHKK